MANIRFQDNPQQTVLDSDIIIPATSTNGGTDLLSGAIDAGDDIKIPLSQLRLFFRQNNVTTQTVSTESSININYALGDYFIVNLEDNITAMTITNPPIGGGSIRIRFIQDSVGGHTVVLPSNIVPIVGTDEEIVADANGQTVLHLTTDDGGITWQYSMKGIDLS